MEMIIKKNKHRHTLAIIILSANRYGKQVSEFIKSDWVLKIIHILEDLTQAISGAESRATLESDKAQSAERSELEKLSISPGKKPSVERFCALTQEQTYAWISLFVCFFLSLFLSFFDREHTHQALCSMCYMVSGFRV